MEKTIKTHSFYLFLSFFLLSSCFNSETSTKTEQKKLKNDVLANELKTDRNGLSSSLSVIKTVHGNITFKYYPKSAPNTVTRVIKLVTTGFYDGLSFHRVIPNFIIQTGDPTGTGKGGSGNKLKSEFNSLQHIRGTLAMARSMSDMDSADSQFYISLGTLPQLDEKYTVFGQVIDGIEVLDKINQGDKIISVEYIE